MIQFTAARYDPTRFDSDRGPVPVEVRKITAEDEATAYEMLGEPFDGTYWNVYEQRDA